MVSEQAKTDALAASVERLSAWGDIPAFADQVQEVMTAAGAERFSLGHLSEAVLQNVSLATKVLKTANSAYFRRASNTLLTMARAVSLLGWRTIRDIAGSTLLFEHFRSRGVPVRELMLLSLLTANHARILARHVGYSREEEAYLCGMFRGLGELLVACYMPTEYQGIAARMRAQGRTPHEASLNVLGFSYDDLGRAMAGRWGLGERVVGCMTRPELVNPTPAGERELLSFLVAFSDELSTAVYRIGGNEGREGMHRLVGRWGPGLSLTHDVVTHVLKTALSETGDAFASAQVPVTSLRLLQPHAAGTTGIVAQPPSPEPPKGVDDSAAPGADLLARLTAEVVSAFRSSAGVGLNDIIMMVLETIRRGTGCDRVLLCLVDRDGLRVRARLGVGVGAADLVSKFRFPVSPLAGPIRLAVLKGEDVFVEEVRQSKYEGTTFASVVRSASFALCPLIVRDEVIGCLYFDRVKEPLGLDERMRGSIGTLQQCGSVALSKMHRP